MRLRRAVIQTGICYVRSNRRLSNSTGQRELRRASSSVALIPIISAIDRRILISIGQLFSP